MLPPESQRNVRVYIDDFIIGHSEEDRCAIITQQLLQILAVNSVKVNHDKSTLLPTTTMEVLRFTIADGFITLPTRRKDKLVNSLRRLFEATHMTKRHRQQILGLIEAAQLGIADVDLIRESHHQ